MKCAGPTYPEPRCLSTHTNGMQWQLLQKLCVCCAVQMPQRRCGRITFTGKNQSSLHSPFKISSVKIIIKVLISANCDDRFQSMNTLQLGRGQRGYTKSSASTSDSLQNHGFFGLQQPPIHCTTITGLTLLSLAHFLCYSVLLAARLLSLLFNLGRSKLE